MADQDQVRKEYGDDTLDGLVPPSGSGDGSLEVEGGARAPPARSLLFYVATAQAFLIVYRTEVFLGAVLAGCVGVAVSSARHARHRKPNPFDAARIRHDYQAVTSKYDLSLGAIDHWCLRGDDNSCRCEDPLEPMSKRTSRKWVLQHEENVKVAQAALAKGLASRGAWDDDWDRDFDDAWVDGVDDDWIFGEGARFGFDDDLGWNPYEDDMDVGSFADPEPAPATDDTDDFSFAFDDDFNKEAEHDYEDDDVFRRRLDDPEYWLDVVFVGDSITEQRQGTSMGKPITAFDGIKEVFDKSFTKEKGGDFNGIAMGISGDTSKNLLWRLINGEMPWGLNPKVWWVGIGINDLSIKGCSEEVVLLGILRVVEEIQMMQPDSTVVINSLLPVKRNEEGLLEHLGKHDKDVALKKKEKNLLDAEMSEKRDHMDLWPSIVAINKGLQKFAAAHQGVKFFNADSVFVEKRQGGKYLKLDLMRDPVHPNLSGHKKWNSEIKKRLHELIKD